MLDAGSEISIVNQRVVDNMIEGIDYERIGDLNLIGPDNNPITNTGRIRIKKHSGLKIQENVQKIGFEASVVETSKKNQAWDALIGIDFQSKIGKTTTTVEGNLKPLVIVENRFGILKDNSGKNISTPIVLDTLNYELEPTFSKQTMAINAFESKEIKTNVNTAAQFLNINNPSVKCQELSCNFTIKNGNIRKNINQGNKLTVENPTSETVIIRKGQLIAFHTDADRVIITDGEKSCGRTFCCNNIDTDEKKNLDMNKDFQQQILKLIEKEVLKRTNTDDQFWTNELKLLLNRLVKENIIAKEKISKIWEKNKRFVFGIHFSIYI